VKALDTTAAAAARKALAGTTDEFLMTRWKLMARGLGGPGHAAVGDDPGHDQSLGASSRPDDGVPAPDWREGPFESTDRRQTTRSSADQPTIEIIARSAGPGPRRR